MPKCLFIIIASLFCAVFAFGQQLSGKALLYLHTDKTVYTNNEEIWFSGYLIKSGNTNIKDHKFMLVSLARQDDNSVLVHQKFIMDNGFSNGNIHLPDSIPPGAYKLMAYTNLVDKQGKPLDVFTQHLTIKSVNVETIAASISLADTVADKNGNYRVLLFAQPKIADKKLTPVITYHVGDVATGKVEQDALGKYELLIPAKSLKSPNPVLYATVKYGKEFKYLSIKLPRAAPKLSVRFFPEGGNITRNMLNTIGMEARVGNSPVSVYGVLLKGNIVIDSIHTNYEGIARFRIFDDGKSSYSFRELKGGDAERLAYPLPAAIDNGLVLSVAKAVNDDTVRFKITAATDQKVYIIVRDEAKEYFSLRHVLKQGRNDFAVDLQGMPKGTATITVLDSLKRPVAERLFFAHHNQRVIAEIKTDKTTYTKRGQVNVTISLKDAITQLPVKALLSVAAVQGNRLEANKIKDIESYVHLYHGLVDSMQQAQQFSMASKTSLEDNLLIRGWRKYTWQDSPFSTDTPFRSLNFIGKVTRQGKPLSKPLTISVVTNAGAHLITTDNLGYFTILPESLYAPYDNKAMLIASAKNRYDLGIKINDPYETLNAALFKETPSLSPADFAMNTLSGYIINELSKTRKLKEVVISSSKDDSVFGANAVKGFSNDCGDWVCFNGILNCNNHREGSPPIMGARYRSAPNNPRVRDGIYIGCAGEVVAKGVAKIDGIYSGREFYGLTKSDLEIPVPQYVSTLYWNPAVMVDESGSTGFSYFNSDVMGTFKIVVQGVTCQSLVSGTVSYTIAN